MVGVVSLASVIPPAWVGEGRVGCEASATQRGSLFGDLPAPAAAGNRVFGIAGA